jgi:hypothetical protein
MPQILERLSHTCHELWLFMWEKTHSLVVMTSIMSKTLNIQLGQLIEKVSWN